MKILKDQNPETEFTREQPEGQLNGVFDVNPSQTLHLFVDFKTAGAETFPMVLAHLEPLRTPVNYLTHFNGTAVVPGPITVHFTGDAPFDLLISNKTYRDYFYDAPLDDLGSGKYTSENSIIASAPFGREVGHVSWGSTISEEQGEKIRAQVEEAHNRGIMARYWETPNWPRSVREKVWGALVNGGVDLLNVDDLKVRFAIHRDPVTLVNSDHRLHHHLNGSCDDEEECKIGQHPITIYLLRITFLIDNTLISCGCFTYFCFILRVVINDSRRLTRPSTTSKPVKPPPL